MKFTHPVSLLLLTPLLGCATQGGPAQRTACAERVCFAFEVTLNGPQLAVHDREPARSHVPPIVPLERIEGIDYTALATQVQQSRQRGEGHQGCDRGVEPPRDPPSGPPVESTSFGCSYRLPGQVAYVVTITLVWQWRGADPGWHLIDLSGTAHRVVVPVPDQG